MKWNAFAFTTLFVMLAFAAACSKNNSTATAPTTCSTVAGSPSTTTFGPEGGTGTVPVTAGSGCTWTSTSNAGFVTISQGATGTANGTVQFTVAANTGAERTGTISVAGTTITITQRAAAAPPSTVTLSAPTPRSPIGGATVTDARPALVVDNAVATGSAGTVTYRFEISDLSSFPNDAARTFSVDGVAQGSGTTTGVVPRDLGPSVLWYWHARATNGTVTSAYSATETFRTPSQCSYVVSPTTANVALGGGSVTVNVTTDSTCAWTASSNATFITVASGGSGSGNGTVTLSVGANAGGARTGTVTVAGQTVTVSQGATGISAGFRLLDPGRGPGATTECQIRSLTSVPTPCTLESTSFPLGTNAITLYSWTVQYIYPSSQKTLTQSNSSPTFTFTEMCGQTPSSDAGVPVDLTVTLTVTDTSGDTVTVTSGTGGQPALTLRMFTCGI